MNDLYDLLDEAQEQLEAAINSLKMLSRETRSMGGNINGQLESYTIPWLNKWINDTNQAGSLINIRRQLDESGVDGDRKDSDMEESKKVVEADEYDKEIPPASYGFVPCSVEDESGAWLVSFDGGKSILLQSDYDQASFAVNSGAVEAPKDWDGSPSELGDKFYGLDPSSIVECPSDYLDQAESVGESSSSIVGRMLGTIQEFTGCSSMGTVEGGASIMPIPAVGAPKADDAKNLKKKKKKKTTVESIIGEKEEELDNSTVSIIPAGSTPVMKVGEPVPLPTKTTAVEGQSNAMNVLLGTEISKTKVIEPPPAPKFEDLVRMHSKTYNATASRLVAKPVTVNEDQKAISSPLFARLNAVEQPKAAKVQESTDAENLIKAMSSAAPAVVPGITSSKDIIGQGVPMPPPVQESNMAKTMDSFRKFARI